MKNILYGMGAVLIILTTSCGKEKVTPQKGTGGTTPPDTMRVVSAYLTKARETHDYIAHNLLTSYKSYRVNTGANANSAYEWYNVSQIYADAAMIAIGEVSYRADMDGTFAWMNGLWDKSDPNGGYFAFANLDGTGGSGTKYIDDNSLTGVAYLDAYEVSSGTAKANYLTAAENCANWVIKSGLWDTTFGGGFWWNTGKTVKPTQSNAIALQMFLRLYKITGQSVYHDWAVSVNTWLNAKMYDSVKGLYIWQIESSGKIDNQIFTYDNAIMLEADLLYATTMGEPGYLARAQAIGTAMNTVLWNAAHNVYIFNTADIRINPTYCGWASQAMIRLYEADNNPSWLSYAKGNVDAINVVMKDATSHGYWQYAGLDGSNRYGMDGVDQAWMQRVQALLSKYK